MARTVSMLIAVTAVGGTTLLWQYLYLRVTLPEAVVSVIPTAAIGALTAYYAVRG
ncbi:hypothetical protein [Halorarius halobius]|uniref:hypothetical protein n=1 Tax=Halorarius halobius TaxID=2962671 RepID=UPI0020CD5182|nr:hypothetical protein [Halorarius halobius]